MALTDGQRSDIKIAVASWLDDQLDRFLEVARSVCPDVNNDEIVRFVNDLCIHAAESVERYHGR